jgi:hypothetical protein
MNKREAGILLIGLGVGLILGMRLELGSRLLALLPSLLIVVGIVLFSQKRQAQKSN